MIYGCQDVPYEGDIYKWKFDMMLQNGTASWQSAWCSIAAFLYEAIMILIFSVQFTGQKGSIMHNATECVVNMVKLE